MAEKTDYKATLNMPRTDFPMRANLPTAGARAAEEVGGDGPLQPGPAGDGRPAEVRAARRPALRQRRHPHGHALNKILKDIIVKHATMAGYDAPYVPGWDMPRPADRAAGAEGHEDRPPQDRSRWSCGRGATSTPTSGSNVQREQFRRLGVRGDWENPYLTLAPEYEAKEVEVFGAMAAPGVHLPRPEADLLVPALRDRAGRGGDRVPREDLALHLRRLPGGRTPAGRLARGQLPDDLDHDPVDHPGQPGRRASTPSWSTASTPPRRATWSSPTALAEKFCRRPCDLPARGARRPRCKGADLEGITYRHLFYDRVSPGHPGRHVTTEDGTGLVHTAPGHGHEDFEVGPEVRAARLSPVNDQGDFTDEAGPVRRHVLRGEPGDHRGPGRGRHAAGPGQDPPQLPALLALQEAGDLPGHRAVVRRGGGLHCEHRHWRRSNHVHWIPEWGTTASTAWSTSRPDWCISRQRAWGVPIPVLACASLRRAVLRAEDVREDRRDLPRRGRRRLVAAAGRGLPAGGRPDLPQVRRPRRSARRRTSSTSGSTPAPATSAVLETRPELTWPADLYLEGSDQHRGWFQSSLLTAVGTRGRRRPTRRVLTHGFVVDEQGRKMSKSQGNVVAPAEVIKQYGADVLRLWVAVHRLPRRHPRSPTSILKQVAEAYRKIRNTLRYLLGNLYDFDPDTDMVER